MRQTADGIIELFELEDAVVTTEVAILNRYGIAMAADRKLSYQTSGGDRLHRDDYQKLFTLSKVYPVGIMVNGNSTYDDDIP